MYLVLGVVSLYQSNFEPTAQFDHRHLLLPAPTGGSGGGGKGGNNRSGSERKKSGDKIGVSRTWTQSGIPNPNRWIQASAESIPIPKCLPFHSFAVL